MTTMKDKLLSPQLMMMKCLLFIHLLKEDMKSCDVEDLPVYHYLNDSGRLKS